MKPLAVVKIIEDSLEDKLGEDIKVLDLKGLSNIADYFVIVNGKNTNHLRSMADDIEQKLQAVGEKLHHSEGYSSGTWILLDYGHVLVHIFNKEEREFYGLEHVWSDAKSL